MEPHCLYSQVAFIGISNWALDPAKMNRGILVQREVPDKEELIESARLLIVHVFILVYLYLDCLFYLSGKHYDILCFITRSFDESDLGFI